MKSFIISMLISLVVIGSSYGANNKYWQCSRCKKIYVGETLPVKPKKCKVTNYQMFHDWVEMILG